jgi:tetratricopeptide (TPR) repeat protein
MSRKDFVDALRKAGWSGNGNIVKEDAPPPADSESRLEGLEELPLFGLLRESYALIRNDGESLPRLGVLVRAYANLGQLSRYHWSREYAVYTARSLLYAQRMVATHPNSAIALWHRAYARALAGMMGDAQSDLKLAASMNQGKPPEWIALIDPLCRYDTEALVNLANGKQAPLAMYFALLTIQNSHCQAAVVNMAQAAYTLNPNCLSILNTLCEETGPGMLNELVQEPPRIFSARLPTQLEQMPSFPADLQKKIEGFKTSGGNPQGREIICQSLIDLGSPDQDKAEPSWTVLGRMVKEITFTNVWRYAYFIAVEQGLDARDIASQSAPLISDHPFKFVIDALGIRVLGSAEDKKRAFSVPPAAMAISTSHQIALYWQLQQVEPNPPSTSNQYWDQLLLNADPDAFDIEGLFRFYEFEHLYAWKFDEIKTLSQVSPQSPLLIEANIFTNWDIEKAKAWESQYGAHPEVSQALGEKYASLQLWSDAERCFRKHIAVSPDLMGYKSLADVYKNAHQDDQQLATLKEFLIKGQDFGLQDCQVQVDIADYYIGKRDYKSAVPYSDAAAATGSGLGLRSACWAHTGIGDWSTGEQMVVEEINHYSEDPISWYSWCDRTGHGDLSAATQTVLGYYAGQNSSPTKQGLMNLACVQLAQKNYKEALAAVQQRMKLWPGPVSGLYIAVIYDQMHDYTNRDAALASIQSVQNGDPIMMKFAAALQDAIRSNKDGLPPSDVVVKIVKDETPVDRCATYALMGRLLMDRGQTNQAMAYFNRCVDGDNFSVERFWVDPILRASGVDTWALEQSRKTQ